MIWKNWSQRDLTQELDALGNEFIEKLKNTLYALEGEEFDEGKLFKKNNLIKVLEAFAPSDIFRKKEYRFKCFNRLSERELKDFGEVVNVHGTNFLDLAEKLSNKNWDKDEFSNKFIQFFQLSEHFLDERKVETYSEITISPASSLQPMTIYSAYKPLKEYQFGVFYKAKQKLKAPLSRFVVQMPTGSGKTRTAMEIIADAFLEAKEENFTIIWLAHSEELCEQAFESFCEVWQHVATKNVNVKKVWGSHNVDLAQPGMSFIVAGFTKINNKLEREPGLSQVLSNRTNLIVVDEAHKTIAPTYANAITLLCGNSTRVVGLTATPGRTIMEESQELSDFYFSDLIGIESQRNESPTKYLRDLGVLSHVDYVQIQTNINFQLSASAIKRLENDLDFSSQFLKEVGGHEVRNAEIVKRLLIEVSNDKRIIVFATSVEHSRFISALLSYYGVKSAHVDGSTKSARRAQIIQEFKNGNLSVLCNFGVLSTGFDAPNTDVVLIARPTNSAVLYSQMIGRGLRGPAIGGTKSCSIIDVKDNIIGFGEADKVYEFFDEYWKL